jgi:hypothetical protein
MVVFVGCLKASLRVLSLTLSSDSVWKAGANGVTNGFVFYDTRPSDDVGFFYRKNKTAVLYNLAKRPSHNKIPVVLIDSDSYSEQELLGQLKGAINQIEGSVSQIKIITKNTTMSDDNYKSMMKFLSKVGLFLG